MSLLSNTDIQRMRALGTVVIHPFNEQALNNTSYDLSFGDRIARYRAEWSHVDLGAIDPSTMYRVCEATEEPGFTGRGFFIDCGERILGHTWEIAGGTVAPCPTCKGQTTIVWGQNTVPCLDCMSSGRIAVTSMLHATSTAARVGLTVCQCAGFGDVGFLDRWTLEIQNHGPRGLWLPVNAVICQVSFYRVNPPIAGTEYTQKGQYAQKHSSPEETHKNWSPDRMLPKRVKIRPSTL